jgi:hypothetical protein
VNFGGFNPCAPREASNCDFHTYSSGAEQTCEWASMIMTDSLVFRLRAQKTQRTVIPSEARNLSWFLAQEEERFLASLGMKK